MCAKFRTKKISSLVGYTYPTLHQAKEWYVDFYAFDPARHCMRRKKYQVGNDLKIGEKKRRAAEIIESVSKQLMNGWNPWTEDSGTRGFTKFEECVDKYLEYVDRMERMKTRSTYRSRAKMMKEYNLTLVTPIVYVYQFDVVFCNDFLDWIYLDRETSSRTRNNYRGWLYGFAEFLINRKYIGSNPIEKVKVLAEHEEKKRKDLTPQMLTQLQQHLMENDKPFLLACMMQYYTLIRPGELSHLKVGDISVSKQTVFVSKQFSKNWRDAEVGLNKEIVKLMIDLGVLSRPTNYFLFGKGFLPSPDRADSDQFNKRWVKMRKALGWSDCYQFYSLKDTGIRDLANKEGVVIARDQARHRDISTTNRYIQNNGVQQNTLNFEGGLSYSHVQPEDAQTK